MRAFQVKIPKALLLVVSLVVPLLVYGQGAPDTFIRGADISFTPQIESLGGTYKSGGVVKDALDILKQNGVNYIRLRLWYAPDGGWCGLEKTLEYVQRVKSKGFKFLLDFHYSDWWADPGKQNKPAAWASISYSALLDSVYAYSYAVVAALKNQGTLPDMVQIGNEITGGMLWPDGKISIGGWGQFAALVKKGIQGVNDAAGNDTVRIMIHIDRGGDNATAVWFYDNLIAQGVQFDVIGLSYYPWWHGTLTQLQGNLNSLASRYGKDIVVVETAYPWTLQYYDTVGNIVGSSTSLLSGYPASVKGQKDFLFAVINIIKNTTNKKGMGFFYWEPSYISVQPIGSPWENLTTFDFGGNATIALTAFHDLDTLKPVNVTVRANTSTLVDTLTPAGVVQIRGEVLGISSSLLPSGDAVTWDATSQLIMNNDGGDYWVYRFKMYPGDQLQYKFWAGFTTAKPTYRNLGWEGPIMPEDSSNVVRLFTAGNHDTVLSVQYFNSKGTSVTQYWTPLSPQQDSVAVLFRVNAAALSRQKVFNPNTDGPIVVRGDSAGSAGVLSWTSDNVVLHREVPSVADSSFWSAVAYFPRANIAEGSQVKYRFFVENSSFGGTESNISDRSFSFPSTDTTLAWQFFNNRIIPTGAANVTPAVPMSDFLFPNYPNPFNPSTTIRFSIARRGRITLCIYDVLGRNVRTLLNETRSPGNFSLSWDGKDESGLPLATGIYLVRLNTGAGDFVRKIVLLK